ncbi:hypothetical protein [Ferrovibrio sp.]|uniref:hypothetical protein n=1 Tax=Ferrovibrio sp. TaxID=1917215 RepID=UPI0035AE8505
MKNRRRIFLLLITVFGAILAWKVGSYMFEQWQNSGHRRFAERLSGLDLSEANLLHKKSEWSIGGPGGYSAYVFQLPAFDDETFARMCHQITRHAITFGAQIAVSAYGIVSEFVPKPPICGLSQTLPSAGVQRALLGRGGDLYVETAE